MTVRDYEPHLFIQFGLPASMAEGVSYTKNAAKDDEVLLEMAEPTIKPSREKADQKGLFFQADSTKKVDYVLVYEVSKEKEESDPDFKAESLKKAEQRESFHRCLRQQGVEMEEDELTSPQVSFLRSSTLQKQLAVTNNSVLIEVTSFEQGCLFSVEGFNTTPTESPNATPACWQIPIEKANIHLAI